MKVTNALIITFFLSVIFTVNAKTFQVQILSQPPNPNGIFTGKIAAADFSDSTPNYCYLKQSCYYAGFVNEKSWGVQGNEGYVTSDRYRQVERMEIAKEAKTMGELARKLYDKGLLTVELEDFLPAGMGKNPTFCVYASYMSGQVVGSLSSNCLDAPIAPVSCTLEPESIVFDWGVVANKSAGEIQLSKEIRIKCTEATNMNLLISGDYISLNGNINTRAEFNLGSGWTGKTKLKVDNQLNVLMKSRLVGLDQETGDFTGSSVLIMEQY